MGLTLYCLSSYNQAIAPPARVPPARVSPVLSHLSSLTCLDLKIRVMLKLTEGGSVQRMVS